MKYINDDIIRIERFSKKRYETYKKKGIPFHVVSGKGRLCEVKAFDCGENKDQVFVESTYKDYTSGHYANQKNGCTQYKEQDGKLFIYLGPWFKKGDLVVRTIDGTKGRTIFFWYGVSPKENVYLENWGMYSPYEDMHDSQFSQCTLGCPVKREDWDGKYLNQHFCLATDKMLEEVAAKIEKLKKKGFAIISPELYKQGDEGRQFEMMLPLIGLGISV